jgi:isopentenyldiphosphate isomerase
METELLNIFDENRNRMGTATRAEVHRLGHWHEAFHCWFVSRDGGRAYIYVQLRSEGKKDYPNLLDISAAGHLLADETVLDGVREIEEELGILVSFDELIPLGVVDYHLVVGDMIDKEFAHVYLYEGRSILEEARLQVEEVSGLFRMDFGDFRELWLGSREQVRIEGFEMMDGKKVGIERFVGKEMFVPHQLSYYERVVRAIGERMGV